MAAEENEMRKRNRVIWMLAGVCALSLGTAAAQQNEGPILLPKPKPVAKPASPTLLVLCDLACNWKLDGETKGRIDAGHSVKVKVELGQHLVVAATEDGADQVQKLGEIKAKGQTVVSIELKPVRDARLKAEQEARDKAVQEAQAKAERDAREKAEQEAKYKVAREDAAGVWTDPATGLMWSKKDNGYDVSWQQAKEYCRDQQLAGYGDWRLPTMDELQGIYDKNSDNNIDVGYYRVKGKLQLSGWEWSNQGNDSGEAWSFFFNEGKSYHVSAYSNSTHALCVHSTRE
jgi:hypothetical protein